MIDLERAAQLLSDWDNILVISHASPDGDTLGSAGALIRGLESLGKKTRFLCADKIGRKYGYIFEGIKGECTEPEHIVTVDVADPKLLGSAQTEYADKVDLAIDHHGTHVPFGKEEFVDADAAANCQIIYKILKKMGVSIDKKMADCLFTGISTDTGCFKYSNANAETHMISADLISLGADCGEINRIMFDTKSRACMEVEKEILSNMVFFHNDKIALACLSKEIMEKSGAEESELEGIPSIPKRIEGVEIGIVLKEKDENLWKASLRSYGEVDSSAVCKKFGGGGHTGAAGCSFNMPYEEAKKVLVEECERYLSSIGI